jgi:protein SCO1
MMTHIKLALGGLLGIVVVMLAGCETSLPRMHATVLPEPKALPEFALAAHTGQTFGNQDLKGQWGYLFFGFTRCPDVCPTTLMTLQSATAQMRTAGVSEPPRVYFISVDSEYDKPTQIAEYLAKFDPDFRGASGDAAQLKNLTQAVGASFEQNKQALNVAMIEHSGVIFVINPQGELRALYTPPHSAQHIADDAPHFLNMHR